MGALLDEVERGGEVMITREGRAVARLVPEPSPALDAIAAVRGLRALRAEIAARGERFTWDELKDMRDEGRR